MFSINYAYLNELRKECGLTNQQIARESEIPEGTVNRIFSTKPPEQPSIVTMACLVSALGGSLDDLMGIICIQKQPEEHAAEFEIPHLSNSDANEQYPYEYALQAARESYRNVIRHLKEHHANEMQRVKDDHKREIDTKDKWLHIEFVVIRYMIVSYVVFIVLTAVFAFILR